jgi:hypothetical protein
MAIAARHVLVSAMIKPTITAVVSAIRIPIGTKPLRGPLKIREAKEAEAITVNTATTKPALPLAATRESAFLFTDSSTAFGYFRVNSGFVSMLYPAVAKL